LRCWRTFDFEKKYGFNKIVVFSLLVMFFVFSFLYVSLANWFSSPINSQHFFWFLVGCLILYPVHKVLHLIPLFRYVPNLKVQAQIRCLCLPVFCINCKEPVSKKRFITSLLFPFLIITPLLIGASLIFPSYIHYFSLLTAIHTGICAIDFMYLKALASSPKYCFIEEHTEGYEILIPQ